MSVFAPDTTLDGMLDFVADNCDKVTICGTQPTTYTEGNATYALADVAVTPGDGNGDFTIANGDTSGRKLTLAAQSGVTVDSNGTALHLALLDTVNSRLLIVLTITSQSVTAGNTASTNAVDMELRDLQ